MTVLLSRLIILALVLALMVSIAGCEIFTTTQTPQTQSDTPYFMLNHLPEIGEYVDDIVYTHRYPDIRDTLISGEEYGKLIPFIGNFRDYHFVNYETGQWCEETMSVAKYGIMNDKGEIIVDAVYDGASIVLCENGEYILSLFQNGEDYEGVSKSLLCSSDGSWVMEAGKNVYYDFYAWSDGLVIVSDYSQVDYLTQEGSPSVAFYDTKNNKLFGFNNCIMSGTEGFSNGYIVLDFFTDFYSYEYSRRFVDINGNLAFPGIYPRSNFEDGKAPANNDSGLCGLFTVHGTWLIAPVYEDIYKRGSYYIASDGFNRIIYDLNGKYVATIDGTILGEQYIRAYGDKLYLEDSSFNALQEKYDSYYTDALTNKPVVCKETGRSVTSHFDGTEYFYGDDGAHTYIVDPNGNTIAKLDGVGAVDKLSEEFFSFTRGSWMDGTQLYSVYSLQSFQKLWEQEQSHTAYQVYFSEISGYIIKTCYPKSDECTDYSESVSEILDIETGKPIFDGLTDFRFFSTGDEAYLSCTDGVYTYCYDPLLTMLMKIRNNETD